MTFHVAAFLMDRASLGRELADTLDRLAKAEQTVRRLRMDLIVEKAVTLGLTEVNARLRTEVGLRAIYEAQIEAQLESADALLAVVDPHTTRET